MTQATANEAPEKPTDAEVRWCDETARLLAALAYGNPRIVASKKRSELRKLSDFFRKVAAEARSIDAPTVRTEDIRRPLELACVAYARGAAEKSKNPNGVWPTTMLEGLAFFEQCRDVAYREFPIEREG